MQSIYENEEQRRYMERELEIFRRSNKKGLAEQHSEHFVDLVLHWR